MIINVSTKILTRNNKASQKKKFNKESTRTKNKSSIEEKNSKNSSSPRKDLSNKIKVQHKNEETFRRKKDRRKHLEMGVLKEGIERKTHQNYYRTLFFCKKPSIFSERRVFGIWILYYRCVEGIERKTHQNPYRTLFLCKRRSIFSGWRVFGVWI